MRCLLLILFATLAFSSFADEEERQEIENRIKPLGQVHIQGGNLAPQKESGIQAAKSENQPGQEIYERYCMICHKDGVASAPKFKNKVDWSPRLKAAGSIDGLVAIAIKGMNVMPPKGTCQVCTEKDLKEAIEYMMPKS